MHQFMFSKCISKCILSRRVEGNWRTYFWKNMRYLETVSGVQPYLISIDTNKPLDTAAYKTLLFSGCILLPVYRSSKHLWKSPCVTSHGEPFATARTSCYILEVTVLHPQKAAKNCKDMMGEKPLQLACLASCCCTSCRVSGHCHEASAFTFQQFRMLQME
jgi:hypothetical protein